MNCTQESLPFGRILGGYFIQLWRALDEELLDADEKTRFLRIWFCFQETWKGLVSSELQEQLGLEMLCLDSIIILPSQVAMVSHRRELTHSWTAEKWTDKKSPKEMIIGWIVDQRSTNSKLLSCICSWLFMAGELVVVQSLGNWKFVKDQNIF